MIQSPLLPQLVPTPIEKNGIQPVLESPLKIETIQMHKGLDKSILAGIFGILSITQDVPGES